MEHKLNDRLADTNLPTIIDLSIPRNKKKSFESENIERRADYFVRAFRKSDNSCRIWSVSSCCPLAVPADDSCKDVGG
jgi:hypothetical protein